MDAQVRAVLSLIVVGTAMFLFAIQAPIPDSLLTIVGVVLTFHFMSSQADKQQELAKTQTETAVKAALAEPPK